MEKVGRGKHSSSCTFLSPGGSHFYLVLTLASYPSCLCYAPCRHWRSWVPKEPNHKAKLCNEDNGGGTLEAGDMSDYPIREVLNSRIIPTELLAYAVSVISLPSIVCVTRLTTSVFPYSSHILMSVCSIVFWTCFWT